MLEFIIGLIIGLILMYILIGSCNCVDMKTISDKLIRQSARYSLASRNDQSPLIALLHANYGVGYWFALKDISGEYNPDINMLKYEAEIDNIQDAATKKVVYVCPNFVGNLGENESLLKIAGDSE